jgi:rRNA maturation endonuclease Nob1
MTFTDIKQVTWRCTFCRTVHEIKAVVCDYCGVDDLQREEM